MVIRSTSIAGWYGDLRDVRFSPPESLGAATTSEEGKKFLTIVSYGVRWNPACATSWLALESFRQGNNVTKGVQVLIVDQEQCLELCESMGIVVGTPAIALYFGGKKRSFTRAGGVNAPFFVGSIDEDRLQQLVSLSQEQLIRDGRTEKIKLPF